MSFITLTHGTGRDLAPDATSRIAVGLYHATATAFRLAAEARWTIATRWRNRQSVRWLADADEAVLRDLGIARSDIGRLVRKGRD
jgi:uncharacterized protein YjiS (DUF1127 family)